MPRFFTENISGDTALITGPDARHIGRVLRMAVGENIVLCDLKGLDYHCQIESIQKDAVSCRILSTCPSVGEPDCQVTLYQAFPKGDKMDFIIQKAVELGVSRVVPVLTRRCVARPDPKAMTGKLARFSRIALEAAKQSGRGRIPQVGELVDFDSAVKMAASDPLSLFFYEGGGRPLSQLLSPQVKSLSLFVGSEGGFDPEEVELAAKAGLIPVTLGPRILRCETAPVCALSVIMYATGNL